MEINRQKSFLFVFLVFAAFVFSVSAQNVKRIVVIKVDGLPGDYVDNLVKKRSERTGKSLLPWFDEIFYRNGTRLANFYSRGMSLSAPSWSLIDTGQHLQIKGNVEFDRYIFRSYDYLNFTPFYLAYGMKERADMPGTEVLDEIKQPIISDAFPYEKRYTSFQLFQRGVDWGVLANGFLKLIPKKPAEFIDEWTIGFDFLNTTVNQHERDIIKKIVSRPEIDYFDYYSPHFDHVSHLNNHNASRLAALQELDLTLGRIWTAIQSSSRADETALVLVSDHGVNSDEKIHSQGYNLVSLLTGANGGAHHVVTKRRLMLDYSIKGVNPLMPLITTEAKDSFYLKNQSKNYPTAMLDFDGNERAALHLRDSDLNVLHILFQKLQTGDLQPETEKAAKNAFFDVLKQRRFEWSKVVSDLTEELDALRCEIESREKIAAAQPKKFTSEEIMRGIDKDARRNAARAQIERRDETDYREYLRVLSNLLALKREFFDPRKLKIEDYIARGAMGERNDIYKLQNYIVGLTEKGLTLNADGDIDFEQSFRRVNYFQLFYEQAVRSNVQKAVGSRPVDFVAAKIPRAALSAVLPNDLKPDEDAIWLYDGTDKQALILTREDENGGKSHRYLPVADLRQQESGEVAFKIKDWSADFPLKIYEDDNFNSFGADKKAWLDAWHPEIEWLRATHKTIYSAAVVNLREQFAEHSIHGFENETHPTDDENLLHRFRARQRRLTETDLLISANDHWNFDVRGFNFGGNHGSLFRVSTNSTLMLAGGRQTAIPRGLKIEEPYDNLSFAPTVFRLMGKTNENNYPNAELFQVGFRRFPGRIISEIFAQ